MQTLTVESEKLAKERQEIDTECEQARQEVAQLEQQSRSYLEEMFFFPPRLGIGDWEGGISSCHCLASGNSPKFLGLWPTAWPCGSTACCLSPTAVGSFDLRRGAGSGMGGPWILCTTASRQPPHRGGEVSAYENT
eukprot:s127_g34.t1